MIFDSHAHYDDEAFEKDREELLKSLPEKGVSPVVNVAAQLSGVTTTVELTENIRLSTALWESIRIMWENLQRKKSKWMKELAGRGKDRGCRRNRSGSLLGYGIG